MPPINFIIIYASISQYLAQYDRAKQMLFRNGNVPTQNLPDLIYQVRKAVQMQYLADLSNVVVGVNATATITINTLGNNGDVIFVEVDDPDFGLVNLAYYTKVNTDNTINKIATSLNTLINANPYGYTSSVVGNVVTITARPNVGADINGKLNVIYNTPLDFITINSSDVLLINGTDQFII